MKYLPISGTEKFRGDIFLINVTFLCYLFRTALPFFKYPFILLHIALIGYTFIYHKNQILSASKKFILNYYILLIQAILLILSFLLSDKIYLTILKDIINLLILLSLFFIARFTITGRIDFRIYYSNLLYLFVLFAFIITVVNILVFFDILVNNDFIYNNSITELPLSNLYEADYNIALLPVFFGFISILYLLPYNKNRFSKISLSLLLLLFSFQIIISGSRRGASVFLLITGFLVFALVYSSLNRYSALKILAKESSCFLILLLLFSFFSFLFIEKVPYNYKNKLLDVMGSKNVLVTKDKITKKILRYTSIINNPPSYSKVNNVLWSYVFIPEDPDSGWGSRIHTTVYPLEGKNVEIVPAEAKGYLMDSTCNASYYDYSNTSESYTLIAGLDVKKGDRYKASVYCFVSDSFNANPVVYGASAFSINNKFVSGKVVAAYNLQNKGVWQKLDLEFECTDGYVPLYLSFMKIGVANFRELKGYVIFAFPQYNKINSEETVSTESITQKINLSNSSYYSSGILFSPLSVLSSSFINYNDPIRNFIGKLVSEDTTYYPYKSKIVLNSVSGPLAVDRILRWEFGIKIFWQEFNWKQKLFGGGFNFLNWYGYYFLKDKTASDWPHNPFLSILLYSGILGLAIYCFFLFKVFYYYIKYGKEYPLLIIFFAITFFFSFFSGGSPFDPPIMGFFSILPFFIHSAHERDNK